MENAHKPFINHMGKDGFIWSRLRYVEPMYFGHEVLYYITEIINMNICCKLWKCPNILVMGLIFLYMY